MRTVSFSDARVRKELSENFICAHTNIHGSEFCGSSHEHALDSTPGECGRGAGRQNVQLVFLSPAGKLIHVSTGFLSPVDLMGEIVFAKKVHKATHQQTKRIQCARTREMHIARMMKLGFSEFEIQNTSRQNEELLSRTGFSSSDNSGESDIRVSQARMLRDAKFVISNPMIDIFAFQSRISPLVGRHRAFFGSKPDDEKGISTHASPARTRDRN